MNVTNSEEVLKNYCKAKGYEKPVYRIISRKSTLLDGHVYRFKHYVCVVSVNGFQLADGDGFSKRIARKKAAMKGLQQLRVYELQNFWQVYQTILPQGLLKDSAAADHVMTVSDHGQCLVGEKKLMITASAVTIVELIPTEGVMTPQSVFSGQIRLTAGEVKRMTQVRERSHSTDSSNLLISAAIEKLKNYKDEEEDWENKEAEVKQREHMSAFSEDNLRLFNEESDHHKSENFFQEIIQEVTHEIETNEEKGNEDLDL